MQLSTRGRYAVMALAELALRQETCERPVTLAEIATSQQLSLCYLEQLFAQLRRAGVVVSVRGPGGGYRLGQPASQLSIAAIVCAVDENLKATRCDADAPAFVAPARVTDVQGKSRQCQTHDLWHELGRQIQLFLAGVTLEDVLRRRLAGRASRPAPHQEAVG